MRDEKESSLRLFLSLRALSLRALSLGARELRAKERSELSRSLFAPLPWCKRISSSWKKKKKATLTSARKKKEKTMFSSRHRPPTGSGSGAPTAKTPWLSARLPLPLDALLSAASVAAGLALFCAFSFKGMRAYEETARHMRYSEDPVLRALFLAHKVSFRVVVRVALLSTALLVRLRAAAARRRRRAARKRRRKTDLKSACRVASPPPWFFFFFFHLGTLSTSRRGSCAVFPLMKHTILGK